MTCITGCGTLQEKVCRGYGKSAEKAGTPFTLYRPASASSVIASGNIVSVAGVPQTAFYALFSVDGKFNKPNKPGNPLWQSFHDCSVARVGDYLVSATQTFFIAQQAPMLPPLAVECNLTLTITRPTMAEGVGALGYHGDVPTTDPVLMSGWPASVLLGNSDKNDAKLPLDVKRPGWKIMLPAWPGVTLRTSDQITDDLGRRYGIDAAELTDMGWRITAVQLEA